MQVAYSKLVEEVWVVACVVDTVRERVEGGDECDGEDRERGPRTSRSRRSRDRRPVCALR